MKNIHLLLIILVIAFLDFSCGSKNPDGEEPEQAAVTSDTSSVIENAAGLNTGRTVIALKRQPFSPVIRTGGIILTDSKDIIVVTAKSSGILKFSNHFVFPGVKTVDGQLLFTISGEELAEDNSELNFMQIKADLEKSRANYERAQKLIPDKIITEEHFLSIRNEYEKSLNAFNNLKGSYGKSGNMINSPGNGYIRDIFVTEGQKVTAGEKLATVVIQHKLVLKSYFSPGNLNVLSAIDRANFTVGYSQKLFRTTDLNGELISTGKSTGENSFYIPLYFKMDYSPDLIEGTFAEVYLIGKEVRDAIAVPNTALMEEYGKLYVFVDDGDGDYTKRYITPGNNNGEYTEVLEGLSENEMIVATGTYQVKLSLMTNTAPAHAHNH